MENAVCPRAATVSFWDGYARWYKLWMEHTRYHDRILDLLMTMAEPGWNVLDIGAGNGVLSLPLFAIGCEMTALEPSTGMRGLLYEQAFARGIDGLTIDDRKWEDVPLADGAPERDLIVACNSLHLTRPGLNASLERIFAQRPRHVFIATEIMKPFPFRWEHAGYDLQVAKYHVVENSFAYHSVDEAWEHEAFKRGRELSFSEQAAVRSRLACREGHFWADDRALIGLSWWERIDPSRARPRAIL